MAKKRIKKGKAGAMNRITGPEIAAMYEQLLGNVVSGLIQQLLPVVDGELNLDGLGFEDEAKTVFVHVGKHILENLDPLLMPLLGLSVSSGIQGKPGSEREGDQFAVTLTFRGGLKKPGEGEDLVRIVQTDDETYAELDLAVRVNVDLRQRKATEALEVVGSEAKSAADLILPGG